MTLTSMTGKPLKHYAQDTVTKERYIVLALETENDAEKCLVVNIDSLSPDIRFEFEELIRGDECQGTIDPWKVLERKSFTNYPNQTMISTLKALRQLKEITSSQVAIAVLNGETRTPSQIAQEIRAYEEHRNKKSPNISMEKFDQLNEVSSKQYNELRSDLTNLETTIGEIAGTLNTLVAAFRDMNKKED